MNWLHDNSRDTTFDYLIQIPLSTEDFKEKMMTFDRLFLGLAVQYDLLCPVDSAVIPDTWVDDHLNDLANNEFDTGWLNLLDLGRWPRFKGLNLDQAFGTKIYCLENGKETHFLQPGIFTFAQASSVELLPGMQEYYWYENVSIGLSSRSNVWLEKLWYAPLDYGKGIDFLDTPINNSETARLNAPRLNSFLKALRSGIEKMDGKIVLDETTTSGLVTEEGILLDGKIIYQEDIDEGRVVLPR